MEERFEEFRDRVNKDAENKIDEILESSRKQMSDILNRMNKDHVKDIVKTIPELNLEKYFKIAQEQENYELCQVIKEEIDSRATNK